MSEYKIKEFLKNFWLFVCQICLQFVTSVFIFNLATFFYINLENVDRFPGDFQRIFVQWK